MGILDLGLVLSSCTPRLSTNEIVDCTYANSTSSSCGHLCIHDEFYPLFPTRCHPSYRNLTHSSESYPGRSSSSIQLYGNSSFLVPGDLLTSLSELRDYTVALYFKERSSNGTLFELNNNLAIRYTSEQQLELFLPQLSDKNRDTIATYDAVLSGQWKSVFFTFQDLTEAGDTLTLLTHFGNETVIDPVTLNSSVPFASTITSITIGEGFNGFLQNVRVYVPKLRTTLNSQVIIPMEASFLPQCLCSIDYVISQSEMECISDNHTSLPRFHTSSCQPEYFADTSTTTMWQSDNNDSSVSLVIGLSPSISLSKIFIIFSSSLPAKTTLQYYSEQASAWRDLQYFAESCIQSFEMGNNEQFRGSTDVNCLHHTSNTTLTFLLAGSEGNRRPRPDIDETPFEVHYNASRVRLIISGFMDSATNFAIRDIEICPNYCLDLEQSCTTTCPGMMTDEGSGMSDILAPSSRAPATSAPFMSTASSVDSNQGNSNMMVSLARTTSAEMTETFVIIDSEAPIARSIATLTSTTISTIAVFSRITEAPTTPVITDTEASTNPQNPSIDLRDAATGILGGITAIFAIIILIFILMYSVKKYHKKKIYRRPLRDLRGRMELYQPIGGHIYDLPGATERPPLPPPRPVSIVSLTESSIQCAPLDESTTHLIRSSFVQQEEHLDNEREHAQTMTASSNIPCANVNRANSEVDLSTGSSSGYCKVDDMILGVSMQKNLAYGLALTNDNCVQESPIPTCLGAISEQDASESSSIVTNHSPDCQTLTEHERTQHCLNTGLFLRSDALSSGTAFSSVQHSGATNIIHGYTVTPKILDSVHKEEEQLCANEAEHSDCDREQLLLLCEKEKTPICSPLQNESTSHAISDERQSLAACTSYERICSYERIHHLDICVNDLLHKDQTKPKDSN